MQKLRNAAVFALTVCAMVTSVMFATSHGSPASASAPSVYSQSYKTVIIYAGRCLHTHSRTVRTYSWSTKAEHYILLARPSVTVSDSYKCHI